VLKRLVFTASMLSHAVVASASPASADMATKLQALINTNQTTAHKIHNEALAIRTSSWNWSGASGIADGKDRPMTAKTVFRVASVTKPYVWLPQFSGLSRWEKSIYLRLSAL
jgi:CubicO group peptidase (beta-lactamase class C family)